jgi:hypothetical protein
MDFWDDNIMFVTQKFEKCGLNVWYNSVNNTNKNRLP